jgi:predicted RNA binding protein YcfA (HicA-like mRNA interferase family)
MPRLGVFSGAELCRLLEKEGFANVRQRGSHVVMQRRAGEQTITVPIPMHKEIRTGTLLVIIRQSRLARSLFER